MPFTIKAVADNLVFSDTDCLLPTGSGNFVSLGDVLVTAFEMGTQTVDPSNTGYALLTSTGGIGLNGNKYPFDKNGADSTDVSVSAAGGKVTWTMSDPFIEVYVTLAISGCDATTPFSPLVAPATAMSTAPTSTLATPAFAGQTMLVILFVDGNSGAVTDPAGLTPIATATSPYSDTQLRVYQKTVSVAADTVITAGIAAGFEWGMHTLLLNPPSGGGGSASDVPWGAAQRTMRNTLLRMEREQQLFCAA